MGFDVWIFDISVVDYNGSLFSYNDSELISYSSFVYYYSLLRSNGIIEGGL